MAKIKVYDIFNELYKSGFICDANILGKQNLSPRTFDSFRKYFNVFKSIIFILYYILCFLTFIDKRQVPIYYCDLTNHLANKIPQFFYSITLLAAVMSFVCFYYFNFSDKSDYYWLKIFKTLRSYEMNEIHERQLSDTSIFIRKIKILFLLTLLARRIMIVLVFSLYSVVVLRFYWNSNLFFGIMGILIHTKMGELAVISYLNFIFYFYLVTQMCKFKLKHLNNTFENQSLKLFSSYSEIKRLVYNHNSICNEIVKTNTFWKRVYMGFIFTSNPITLLFCYQMLFTEMDNIIFFLVNLTSTILSFMGNIVLNMISASINKETKSTYVNLLKFQDIYPIKIRFKVRFH